MSRALYRSVRCTAGRNDPAGVPMANTERGGNHRAFVDVATC